MKAFIIKTLVQMHKETTTDQYGQVSRHNFTPHLFGDKSYEVEEYCRKNKGILQYSTFAASWGTYKAFVVEDQEIRKACREALKTNPHYIRNTSTRW
jgi:hypothetical protein